MSSTLRCLEVLDVLAQEPNAFTFNEIVERLGVEKSSVHRFLQTMISAGLVEQDPATRAYHLAGKALWVGTGYLRYSPIYRAAYTELEHLAHATKAMAHLGVWDSGAVLYLHTTRPPGYPLLFTDVGGRRPVHSTALGKVMLAHRSGSDLDNIFAHTCQRFTESTITSIDDMRVHLERIGKAGYALDDQEGMVGLRCLAAPVRDMSEAVVAAVSISLPAGDLPDAEVPRYAKRVQEAAMRISVQLGYRPHTADLRALLAPVADDRG